jgi:hypothetical protein
MQGGVPQSQILIEVLILIYYDGYILINWKKED